MTSGDISLLLRRIFWDCNRGGNSHQLYLHGDAITPLFSALDELMILTLDYLTHPDRDESLRDAVAEVTIVFLLSAVKERSEARRQTAFKILTAEVTAAEHLHGVLTYLDLDFGPSDLWSALIHFEAEEKVEPFTTDYFFADPLLRNQYIAHACLDAAFPGNTVPQDAVDYAAENLDRIQEISLLVHQRKSFSVNMIEEVMGIPAKSLSYGML